MISVHNMNADARGGCHAHAKWLQDHESDDVRCRLVATQLAIGERLEVTQSTPPLMVARLLLAIASLHVDENEAHDWVVGFGDVPRRVVPSKDGRGVVRTPTTRHVLTWVLLEAHKA